jgi:WD40 repeat protein
MRGRVNASGIALSPDGKRLASASLDGIVQIWDVASEKLVMTLVNLPQSEWLAFSPAPRYRGSVNAEPWGAIRIADASVPVFPLATIRGVLRIANSTAPLDAASPEVYPPKRLYVGLALQRLRGDWQITLIAVVFLLPHLLVALFRRSG